MEPHPAGAAGHPGPDTAALPARVVQELISHARREAPNEACGVILGSGPAASGGHARSFVPTRNAAASPYRYEIDSQDLLRLTLDADEHNEVFWGIVHSHTHTAARPSPTDVGLAFYPDALYILVSLEPAPSSDPTGADPTIGDPSHPSPSVRAWRIVDGGVFEVVLEVTE
jgi:proteasome lid subunit RPN8/RPN11